jgi:hypothetical protein
MRKSQTLGCNTRYASGASRVLAFDVSVKVTAPDCVVSTNVYLGHRNAASLIFLDDHIDYEYPAEYNRVCWV